MDCKRSLACTHDKRMSADGQAPTGELSGASQAPSSCALSRKCSTCGRAGHNSRTCLESRETTAAVIHDAGEPRAVEGTAPQQHAEEKSRRAEDDAPSEDSAGDSLREVRKKGELAFVAKAVPDLA